VPYGRIADPAQPEFAVAYEAWAVEGALAEAGLRLGSGWRRGKWSGVEGPTYQDLVFAER